MPCRSLTVPTLISVILSVLVASVSVCLLTMNTFYYRLSGSVKGQYSRLGENIRCAGSVQVVCRRAGVCRAVPSVCIDRTYEAFSGGGVIETFPVSIRYIRSPTFTPINRVPSSPVSASPWYFRAFTTRCHCPDE